MSGEYNQLLDATLQHLQELKADGAQFVNISPQTLALLSRPVPKRPAPRPSLSSAVPAAPRQTPHAVPAQAVNPVSPAPLKTMPSLMDMLPKPKPLEPPLPPAAREAAMTELRQKVLACTKCPNLVSSRKNVVFGVGDIQAELMFVGEAPGADEDEQGEPFVGLAGQLLTKIIQAMGLSRQTVYIGNILKCRPDTPGQTSGNRKPTPAEMQTCIPWLHAQIDIIRPKVLVALGATAVEGLLGKTIGITKLRGSWQTYRGIPLMPTYHPAYLLRNQAMSEKRKVWEDMLQVMTKLAMPISEKQQNYFLSKM